MKNAGLVYSEKEGLKVHYYLTSPCILDFYSCVESVVKCRADKAGDSSLDLKVREK